ncbi:MAG: thioesterase family protein [bacterium]|jgi:acyl-CoA thioester hydrolase|nr:acyl-CoA thioesterase [Planctomycetota bacterium]HIL52631.1 acyl-CoA thioesterase [Planctomycetota bacterium]
MAAKPHETDLRVRYSETDQMGVVHHANYLAYIEEARTLMMETLGLDYAELEASGIGLPVRQIEVRYRQAAYFGDELLVRTWVAGMRAASVTFEYELLRPADGVLIATAKSELACVDLSKKPLEVRALPADLRRRLESEPA